MTYEDALRSANEAKDLGDQDLELDYLEKAHQLKASTGINEPSQRQPPTLPDAMSQSMTEGVDATRRFALGAKSGYDQMALGLADLFGQKTPELEKEVADTNARATGVAGDAGRFAGGLAPFIATGPASGIGLAMATTPGGMPEREKAGLYALAGTVAGKYAGKGLGALLGGFKPSTNAVRLMDQGIQPTVGQGIEQGVLGKGIRKAEEATTSLPFIGSITRNARDRAQDEWGHVAMGMAEVPGVSSSGKLGHAGISELQDGFRNGYQDALGTHMVRLDPKLYDDIEKEIANKTRYLGPQERDYVRDLVKHELSAIDTSGSIAYAKDLAKVESNLASQGSGMIGSRDFKDAAVGHLLNDVEDVIANYRSANMPQEAADRVKELDNGYAAFKRLQRAATAIGAPEGVSTPAQLLNAVKAMDKSKDKSRFGRGEALMQDIAESGKSVLGQTLGESGTTPRALMNKMLLGGGEAAGASMAGIPATATLAGLMGLGSTRAIQKALLGGYPAQSAIKKSLAKSKTPPGLGAYFGREEAQR